MKHQRGFTLIEGFIVAVIVIIVLVMGINAYFGLSSAGQSTISWGYNGATEVRCIDGYKFIISNRGMTRQVMDELGHGVKCDRN